MSAKKSSSAVGPQQKTLFSFFGKPSPAANKTLLNQQQKDSNKNVSPDDVFVKNSPVRNKNIELKENNGRQSVESNSTPLRVGGLKRNQQTPCSADRRVRFSVTEGRDSDDEVITISKGKKRSVVLYDSDDDDAMDVGDHDNNDVKVIAVSPASTKAKKRQSPGVKGKSPKRQKRDEDYEDDDDDSFIVDEDELDDDDDDEEADCDDDISDDDSGRGSKAKKSSKGKGGGKRRFSVSKSSSMGTPVCSRTKEKLSAFQSQDDATDRDPNKYLHATSKDYDFLLPGKIRDAKERKPDHPDYDPTTLYVPPVFLQRQTPAMKQWWQMKSKYFDTVLCFKLGKFYELYHMDAVTAVNELGLIFMRGELAHAGFPEISYSRYADQLVQRGFKVGRVEQTETPSAAADRAKEAKRPGSKSPAADREKVVRRELCQIVTVGTRTPDMMCGGLSDNSTGVLMAVAERSLPDSDKTSFGVAFVDTSIGMFHLSQFTDDRARSSLRTVIAANRPAQILIESKQTTEDTMRVLSTSASAALRESLPSTGIAWNATKLVTELAKCDYFRPSSDASEIEWPPVLREMLSDPSSGVPKPNSDYELCLSALGAMTSYLRKCLIDETLLSLRQFVKYTPPDIVDADTEKARGSASSIRTSRVVLDSITLRNLDLMENSATGTREGTLLELLDTCSTEFGRRQLKEWIASPLTRIEEITDRQLAVSELGNDMGLSVGVRKMLSKLPDLDRSLNKMHTFGHPSKSSGHPDSRAVLFDDDIYRKRRIEELVTTMNGFKTSLGIFQSFAKSVTNSDGFESKLLSKCVLDEKAGGMVPDIEPVLDNLEKLFDLQEAKRSGKITPKPGLCKAYDDACREVEEIMQNLEDLRAKYKSQLRANCVFFGTARNRYQLEVAETVKVPHDFVISTKRKGYRRYRTKEIDEEFQELQAAEERREAAMRDSMRATFAKFDEYFPAWQKTVRCLATLDCLLALSNYSSTADFCVPEFADCSENDGKPFIAIEQGCHPCLLPKIGSSLIANDTYININSNASALILTGPNMGGKSTLERQVGLLVVLAHLGCKVPAKSMRLSPVDRIFTRMGASDRILAGESTFYVELAETAVILQRATEHSLVLLDELGRGTATYDGLSVAAAVLEYLASDIKCRTIFSTHYHLLVSTLASSISSCSNNISLNHMACKVDKTKDDEGGIETITFLYQLVPGACPRSYGFNAARLAGLPDDLIERASKKAEEFEREERVARKIRSVYQASTPEELLEKLKIVEQN